MTARALVLGSGGLTGAAWLAGLVAGLSEAGVDLRRADRIIGTSAGALVGARLAAAEPPAELYQWARTWAPPAARLPAVAVARLLAAQVAPRRQQALIWLGRVAGPAAVLPQARWRDYLDRALAGIAWPAHLSVVCMECRRGRAAIFDEQSGVPLGSAVAASCAMPGIFPPVSINGREYFDGGLRSPANADLAAGVDRVLVLAPLTGSARPSRRPQRQLRALGPDVRSLLLTPAGLGPDIMDPRRIPSAARLGRAQGLRWAEQVARVWAD